MKTMDIIEKTATVTPANTTEFDRMPFDNYDITKIAARAHRERGEAIGAMFSKLITKVGAWLSNRQAELVLSQLDDRLLKDIGINRGDIPMLLKQANRIHGVDRLAAEPQRYQVTGDIKSADAVNTNEHAQKAA